MLLDEIRMTKLGNFAFGDRGECNHPKGGCEDGRAASDKTNPFEGTRILGPAPTGGAGGRNRTADARIFSPSLYRLSYPGKMAPHSSDGGQKVKVCNEIARKLSRSDGYEVAVEGTSHRIPACYVRRERPSSWQATHIQGRDEALNRRSSWRSFSRADALRAYRHGQRVSSKNSTILNAPRSEPRASRRPWRRRLL